MLTDDEKKSHSIKHGNALGYRGIYGTDDEGETHLHLIELGRLSEMHDESEKTGARLLKEFGRR